MTGVKDAALERLIGWPTGIDNLSLENQLGIGTQRRRDSKVIGALRVAENVDITEEGKVTSREGFALAYAAAGIHSVYGHPTFPLMLAVFNGNLVSFDNNLTITTITALTTPLEPMSYDTFNGSVYYSNKFDSGRVDDAGVRSAWAVAPPLGTPTLTVQPTTGGLDAGMYQIALTYIDAEGRESGSSDFDQIDVPGGGGVLLTAIPQSSDPSVAYIRVYASQANGDVLYQVYDLLDGATTFLLGVHQAGKAMDTEFQEPLPSGHIVRFHNGRQYVFRDNVLFWSEALHPGQGRLQSNYVAFTDTGTLLEGVGEGPQAALYAAAGDRTYLMNGADPKAWTKRIAHTHGAVPRSSAQVDMTALGLEGSGRVPFWLDNDGQFVIGTAQGVQPLHKDHYAAEVGVASAATVMRESGGVRHIVSVLHGGYTNSLAISDTAVAEVWKNGVRIS